MLFQEWQDVEQWLKQNDVKQNVKQGILEAFP